MGMFDMIIFDKAYACSQCGAEITSTQTKAFDQALGHYHVKDCISHAEDVRVVKEELFCKKCSKFGSQYIYIAVQRGILVGVADTPQAAQSMLGDMNQEKMILWYHDLFKRYREEARERRHALNFMGHVVEWFEKGYHKIGEADDAAKVRSLFIWDKEYLEEAREPLDAIKRYLAEKEKKDEEPDLI